MQLLGEHVSKPNLHAGNGWGFVFLCWPAESEASKHRAPQGDRTCQVWLPLRFGEDYSTSSWAFASFGLRRLFTFSSVSFLCLMASAATCTEDFRNFSA